MSSILGSLVLVLMLSSAVCADVSRSEYNAIKLQEAHDPEAAFGAMLGLARAGYIPAANRVGYYYRHGLGTHKDLEAARQWYQSAAASGHRWAFASLARVELALGDTDAALHLLQQAARDQHPGTARLLGTAHIDRAFGAVSDPALGQNILDALARDGDANAARDLLLRYNWNRIRGHAPDHIVDRVVQTGLEGDARFAEAALVYLTRAQVKRSPITQQREALISVPGIQRRTLLMERVRLAADMRPGRFWIETEKVLQDAETEHYARVASTAFWINKNAWVRVLQKELRGLGYYSGRITAEMTAQTIRAQNQFCKDRGIWELCASGPLRGQTVRAVADAIAMARERG